MYVVANRAVCGLVYSLFALSYAWEGGWMGWADNVQKTCVHTSFLHQLDNLGTHTSCYGNSIYVYREYVALPAYDVDITLHYT